MIKKFEPTQQQQLKEFVLEIQNGEFGLGFEPHELQDLINTQDFYSDGGFWIAEIHGEIVGCIGLQKLNSTIGILRKMFVKKIFVARIGTLHSDCLTFLLKKPTV